MTRRRRKFVGWDARDIGAACSLLHGLSRANARELSSKSIWFVRRLIAEGGFPFHRFSKRRRDNLLDGVFPGVLKEALRRRARQ